LTVVSDPLRVFNGQPFYFLHDNRIAGAWPCAH
jgi:hypothetical protein